MILMCKQIIRQKLIELKGKAGKSIIIVVDLNSLSMIGRTSKKRISKSIEDWNVIGSI